MNRDARKEEWGSGRCINPGDAVRIQGLTSAKGSALNGEVAYVCESQTGVSKGRMRVNIIDMGGGGGLSSTFASIKLEYLERVAPLKSLIEHQGRVQQHVTEALPPPFFWVLRPGDSTTSTKNCEAVAAELRELELGFQPPPGEALDLSNLRTFHGDVRRSLEKVAALKCGGDNFQGTPYSSAALDAHQAFLDKLRSLCEVMSDSLTRNTMTPSLRCCTQCGKEETDRGAGDAGGGGVLLQACSRCKVAVYCGAACQKAAWPGHKAGCKAAAAERAKDTAGEAADEAAGEAAGEAAAGGSAAAPSSSRIRAGHIMRELRDTSLEYGLRWKSVAWLVSPEGRRVLKHALDMGFMGAAAELAAHDVGRLESDDAAHPSATLHWMPVLAKPSEVMPGRIVPHTERFTALAAAGGFSSFYRLASIMWARDTRIFVDNAKEIIRNVSKALSHAAVAKAALASISREDAVCLGRLAEATVGLSDGQARSRHDPDGGMETLTTRCMALLVAQNTKLRVLGRADLVAWFGSYLLPSEDESAESSTFWLFSVAYAEEEVRLGRAMRDADQEKFHRNHYRMQSRDSAFDQIGSIYETYARHTGRHHPALIKDVVSGGQMPPSDAAQLLADLFSKWGVEPEESTDTDGGGDVGGGAGGGGGGKKQRPGKKGKGKKGRRR